MSEKKYKFDPVFDLNRDMLETIYNNFKIEEYVNAFLEEINRDNQESRIPEIAEKIFSETGKSLARDVVDISDKEDNRDRGYQILREYCMRPENEAFPHLIQRFIEVVYLSVDPKLPEVGLLESSRRKLSYWIDEEDCHIYQVLREKCNDTVLSYMPCQHICMNMLDALCRIWGVKDYDIEMEAVMSKNQLCKFNICRPGVILPKVPIMRWEE